MDMRLDQAGDHQAIAGIQFPAVRRQTGRDGSDCGALDADIDDAQFACPGDAGITNNQVHQSPLPDTMPR